MITLLFDIDGTLINTGGAGGAALLDAFRDAFGITQPGKVPFSGRTDRGIGRSLFELHGIEDTSDNWELLRRGYVARLSDEMPRRQGTALPGIRPLIDHLATHDDVALGLLTGNVRDGARIKLRYFQLYEYFPFGGFGDEHHERNHVARAACEDARVHLGERFDPQQICVIGDTPLDIQCARAIQARVLAVATGIHPREELAAAAPDHLVDDLSDTAAILDWLGVA